MISALALFMLFSAGTAPTPIEVAPPGHFARVAITGDLTSIFFINSLGVSVSYRLFEPLALSATVGGGVVLRFGSPVTYFAGQLMVHGLFGGVRHFFEIAAGASLTGGDEFPIFMRPFMLNRGLALLPAAFLGYRYQPRAGGVVYRGGLALNFGFSVGTAFSMGYAF